MHTTAIKLAYDLYRRFRWGIVGRDCQDQLIRTDGLKSCNSTLAIQRHLGELRMARVACLHAQARVGGTDAECGSRSRIRLC